MARNLHSSIELVLSCRGLQSLVCLMFFKLMKGERCGSCKIGLEVIVGLAQVQKLDFQTKTKLDR